MMNIVMSANDYVYCGVELVIYSTLTHNKNINWYIFTMNVAIRDDEGNYKAYKGLNDRQQEKLRKIVKYLDKNSNITFIDCAPFYQKHLEGSVNEQSDFTPYATLRLIMDKALPYVNETLYFDCDVGVMGNFESMYRDCAQQKSESCFAVYADDANQHEGEMVSGVMFLNLDTIRRNGFLDRARDNYMKNFYMYPDQMALRDSGAIAHLNNAYGYLWDYQKRNVSPIIVHFTNDLEPKIYDARGQENEQYFYRRFPEFAYVRTGLRLIDQINGL